MAARGLAAALVLLLTASCAVAPRLPASVDPKLEAACKTNYSSHRWKLAEPPEPAVRRLYTIPRDAAAQLWFRGSDQAIAVCIACAAGSPAVRSFEWYLPGFKKGELGLRNCPGAARPPPR